MISIEFANAPIDAERIREQDTTLADHRLIKLGLAVMVLDEDDRIFTLSHEARDREFGQNALGPSMETFRYVPKRGENMTESPLEAWMRSLKEEVNLGPEDVEDAEIYFCRDSLLFENIWILGENEGVVDYAAAISMVVRSFNPDALLRKGRSREVLSTRFMSYGDILSSVNTRPGFKGWLMEINQKMLADDEYKDRVIKLDPVPLPDIKDYGTDVRFD